MWAERPLPWKVDAPSRSDGTADRLDGLLTESKRSGLTSIGEHRMTILLYTR